MRLRMLIGLTPLAWGLALGAQDPSPLIHPQLKALGESPALVSVGEALTAPRPPLGKLPSRRIPNLLSVAGNRVKVHITALDPSAALEQLRAIGFEPTAQESNLLVGFLPMEALSKLGQASQVHAIQPAFQTHRTRSGLVQSQGDVVQRSEWARNRYGLTGAGVKIGIMSDSYNTLGGAAAGIHAGELPGPGNPDGYLKPVEILADYTAPDAIDEGRAMAEIIHDVAPGATMAFATGFTASKAEAAANLRLLAKAGCRIVVDDTFFYDEPYFRDGVLNAAIEDISRRGAAYVVSAGNDGDGAFMDSYRPASQSRVLKDLQGNVLGEYDLHNYNPKGLDHFQAITLQPGQFFFPWLQWNDRWQSEGDIPGARVDLDFFIATRQGDYGSIVARSSAQWTGFDPIDFLWDETGVGYTNTTSAEQTIYFLIGRKHAAAGGAKNPTVFKWVDFGGWGGGHRIEYGTPENRPTMFGRSLAVSAISVGASFYGDVSLGTIPPALAEYFTSRGGAHWTYVDAEGTRTLQYRPKPEVVGPDGANTSFFYPGSDLEGDGFPNFLGTSASAPHVAGVGALMLQVAEDPLRPLQLRALMIKAAEDMDDPDTTTFDRGFDGRTGFGLLNAAKAVGLARD